MVRRSLFVVGMVVIGTAPPLTGRPAWQVAPSSSPIMRPAFQSGTGPVVAIDEAHKNTHTHASAQFQGLVELIRSDGYKSRAFATSITRASLGSIDVLVVANPGGWEGPEHSLNATEIAVLMDWVRGGGSLLVILDHRPAPRNAAALAAAMGIVRWHDGTVLVEREDAQPIGNIIFWRPEFLPAGAPTTGPAGPGGAMAYQATDAILTKHAVSEGRGADERVRRVVTFVGSAFQPPEGAEPLLILPKRAVSLTPTTPDANTLVSAHRTSVGNWLQGAVMRIGKGRAAVFGETGLFSGGAAPDNRAFLVNVFRWLTRVL